MARISSKVRSSMPSRYGLVSMRSRSSRGLGITNDGTPPPWPKAAAFGRRVSVDRPSHHGGAGKRAEGAAVGAGGRMVTGHLDGARAAVECGHPLDEDALGMSGVTYGHHRPRFGPGL